MKKIILIFLSVSLNLSALIMLFYLIFFSCTRSRIRHRSSNIDHATVTWIEMGLDRVQSEVEIKASALKKWQGFLKQHVMQNLERVSYK